MNRDYVLFNLREARSELERTIREIETDTEYGHGDFVVAMGHIYHHVNTAWNARDSSEREARECSQQDFDRWRQFPSREELFLT
jgi:hypothetical protein